MTITWPERRPRRTASWIRAWLAAHPQPPALPDFWMCKCWTLANLDGRCTCPDRPEGHPGPRRRLLGVSRNTGGCETA